MNFTGCVVVSSVHSLSPLAALALLFLVYLIVLALAFLVALALQHRRDLHDARREQANMIVEVRKWRAAERTCVLRDITAPLTQHKTDVDLS